MSFTTCHWHEIYFKREQGCPACARDNGIKYPENDAEYREHWSREQPE